MAETKNTKSLYNTEIPSDWEVKKFEKIAKFFSGGTPLTSKPEYYSGNIPFIKSGEIYFDKTEQFISDEGLNNSSAKMVEKGDLLFALYGANSGEVAISKIKGAINQAILCIRHNGDCETVFIYNYLLQQKENIIRTYLQGGQGNLSAEIVKTLPIPLPPLPEQKAIAQVLSTADSAIHTTEKLIAQKELRKKWLMQQLLTGKKRLKGFGGEWKEYHLGSLGETYTGLTGKNKDDFGEGKPYIPYLNIFNNARIDVSNLDYVKITVSDIQNKVKHGDIFFTVSSETPDEVGMASVMLDEIEELYLNSFCFGFRLYDFNILVPEFSSYFLRADAFRTEIYKLSQGATRFNLSKNKLMKLNIVLPPKDEQTAIAQVLQAADKEISLLKAKAEKLREQKKGLMQQLLSGKKRIKV